MNLERIIGDSINRIVPKQLISLNIFDKTITDAMGKVSTTYITYNNLKAQVQLENKQKIEHKDYFNQNTIYKRFYIQSYTLTGLNRNISTAGDYIIMHGLYYKIVEVVENFLVGWVQIVGAESSDGVSG